MKQRKVICEKCNGVVESREDLITSILFLPVVAYHEKCFAEHISYKKGFILPGLPLNGKLFNINTFIATIFGAVGLLFSNPTEFVFLIFFLPLATRLYSYFTYERRLKKLTR